MLHRSRSIAFFIFLTVLLTAGPLFAQTLTWGVGGAGGSGQWDTTTVDWYNGSANVPWTNGDSAVFAGTAGNVSISGSVTANQVTFSTAGYIVQNGFLIGAGNGLTVQADADATISSAIFGAGGVNTPFTKTGTGTLLVTSGSGPVFFNAITVANGELRYGSTTFLSASTPYVLGNTASAALTFGMSTGTVGSLSGGGTTGGVVRPNGTSGSFALAINGSSDATYGGTFAGNGSATLSLQKNGSGTQTLTNTSYSLTGTTTVSGGKLVLSGANGALPNLSGLVVNAGGTFQLDNGSVVNQTRLATGLPVTLNGGTMSFVGNTASQDVHQTVGALNVANGASTVSVTSAGTGVAQLIFNEKLSRTNGATVSFSGGGHVTLTGASNSNGILGAYATVGADWASVNASGGVVAYAAYTTDTTTASNTDNLRLAPSSVTTSLANVLGRNSLNLVNTGNGVATVDVGANGSLTLASGGLLTSGGSGFVIQNGKLNGGNGELVVTNQSALTISSPITTGAVTKSGAGTLLLSGANTYAGATTINQGTVQVAADTNLGTGKAVILNGGMLQASGSFASTKSLQGAGGTVDTAGNNVTFDSAGSTASFTKTGAGTLTVTRQNGAVTVNGGTLRLTTLVGGNSTAVTLIGGRLEAGDNGLQSVTTLGGSPVVLSPGQIGEAASFTTSNLSVLTSTVVDFDLGGVSRNDFLSIGFNLTLGGTSGAQLLFRFNNLGSIQTGTTYSVASLPSSQFGQFSASNFGLDSASAAAGYRGSFSIVNGTVNVNFSAVPEPSVTAAWLCGALALWGGRTWRRRRTARA